MILGGVDVGAATTKTVILQDDKILGFAVINTGSDVIKATNKATHQALDGAGVKLEELDYVVSTGYGRESVTFRNKTVTEIICHAAGVSWMMSGARTVIDIGGQDSKVIGIDEDGRVNNFIMNDKCAAGTGRFLEVMARVLEIDLDEMGPLSLQAKKPCSVSSTCTVFAESEMISLRAKGEKREDLISGIHKAMAHRVAIMGQSVGFKKQIALTGGVAHNIGIKKALEEEIKMEIITPDQPQIMGALGAALLARTEAQRKA